MNIAALVAVRKNSERCKNKMLRRFANKSLVSVSLDRLNQLQGFDAKYFAAHEEVFLKEAACYPVTIIKRSYESANIDEPINKIHEYLADIPEEYIMWINTCNVFLSIDTINKAVNSFKNNGYKSMTSVVKNRNWFYTIDGIPVNNLDPINVSTKTSPPLYEVVHAFHIFERKYFLENSAYWHNKTNDPYLFEIPEEENIDIDTELEFKYAEMIYIERNYRE